MSTIVYVDGFNLYYGALKGSSLKWLDLEAFCHAMLPQEDITLIRYFTAHVSGKVDPDAPTRQGTYLRALATLPSVAVHYGNFLTNATRMPLANPRPGGAKTVAVIKTEEKGSDVNLASHLLWDAFTGRCDSQVLVSDDSDFREAVRIAHDEMGMRLGIINPHRRRPTRSLSAIADYTKRVTIAALASSRFADPLIAVGHQPISKPPTW